MKTKCPCCKSEVDYALIHNSAHPDSISNEACCYDCLPDSVREAFDEFFAVKKLHGLALTPWRAYVK